LEKLHLLKLSEKKELFSPAFETEEKEEIPVTYLKNTKSALKKLVKKTNETIFLIENGREREKIFQNKKSRCRSSGFFMYLIKGREEKRGGRHRFFQLLLQKREQQEER
jgi:hypothetical protein